MVAVQSIDLPSNDTYTRLEFLTFDVNFDGDVSVSSGIPRLRLQVGAQEIDAQYLGVTGSSTLSFQYQVLSGAFDGDGIAVLGLTGNVIDQDGDPAELSLDGLLGDTSGILVDAVIPTVQSIVRAGSAAERTNASSVAFTVTFSREVVNVSAGDFEVGGAATGDISVSGSGSVYTVTVSNISGAGALRLNLKSAANIDIQDEVGNPVLMPFTTGEPYLIDNIAPAVTSVAAPSALTYGTGAELSFVVNFDEAVTVTGNPQLSLTIGSSTVQAAYASGSGTTALTFKYTILSGQLDADGVAVGPLGLNGGTIRDAAGNAATLTLNSVASTSGVLVDAYVPLEVASIDGPDADTYAVGQTLEFKVTFNGDVEVAGTPRIALTIGGDTRYATYASGDGSDTLTFTYEVQSSDSDANGIATAATIELNGGSIKENGTSRDVDRDLPAISGLSSVLVDGVAPEVSDIVRVGSANPTNATSLQYTITFDETVTGVTFDDFSLFSIGDADGDIAVTGSGSTYTVTVSDITGDGSLRLDLKASGTGIKDAHGNAIATGFATGQTYTIDNTPPAPPTFDTVAADDIISAGEVGGLKITGTTEADTTVSLTIGGLVRAATVTGTDWSYSVTASDLTNMGAGAEQLKIVAKDAAGNASIVETLSISVEAAAVPVDDTPPSTPPPSTEDQLKAALTDAEVMERFSQSISSIRSVKEHLGVDDGLNVTVNLGHATSRFLEGITSKEEFEKELTKAVLPTTGVAHSVYKYFTGSPPTEAGMEYLIDSAANPNDLTDPYYQKFSVENRFINFAVNLGKEGEGRAKFEADYGALTFSEAVSKAYGEIIGFNHAANFGVDVEKALTYIESQRAYFEALGGDPIGAKAAMIGYVISVGHAQEVGDYHLSLLFGMGEKLTGVIGSGAGFSPMGDWDLI